MKPITLGVAFLVTLATRACAFEAASQPALSTSPGLPGAIIQELSNRGCKIPGKKAKSVIHGEFFKSGQSDWAALCSTKNSTSLLVFPGGSREQVAVLETRPKAFTRWSISVISQEQLKATWVWKEPKPTDIDHQGINSWLTFGEPGGCLYCYSEEGRTYYHYQDSWLAPATTMIN